MNDESKSGGAGQLSKFTGLRGKASVARATRYLILRLADCDEAIAVALTIARDESIVPQARAAALQTVARLMSSAARIGTSLARMNGSVNQREMDANRRENAQKRAEKNVDRPPLSTDKTAELREKLRAYPRGDEMKKNYQTMDEPDKHLPPFRIR
ncbi:MAG TPA: hypothetical protein VGT78_05100 [Rhizomicrobium sp.]|nr:hypothetical protein [Rhizomicrobium sp.]